MPGSRCTTVSTRARRSVCAFWPCSWSARCATGSQSDWKQQTTTTKIRTNQLGGAVLAPSGWTTGQFLRLLLTLSTAERRKAPNPWRLSFFLSGFAIGHAKHPRRAALRPGDALAKWLRRHRTLEAVDQQAIVERLGQESDSAVRKGTLAIGLTWVCGHENDGSLVTFATQPALQVQPAQSRHLHVGDHAFGIRYRVR